MKGVATEKVPGGKLLRIYVEYDQAVTGVKITGDFFLHPEEAVQDIESYLIGLPVSESEEAIKNKVATVIAERNIQLIGITPEAIAKVVKEAMK